MSKYYTFNSRLVILMVSISSTLSVLAIIIFGLYQWPLVCGDTVAYWPPVIHGRDSGDFLNPVWSPAAIYDPQGAGRLTYHGFFLQWLLRSIGAYTYTGIYMWIAMFGALAVVLVTATILYGFRKNQGVAKLGTLIYLILIPPSSAHLYIGVFSRPESLVVLLSSMLGLFLMVITEWSVSKAILCGVIVAMAGLTSPVAGILLSCLLVLVAAGRGDEMPLRWCAWFSCTTAMCAVILFCIIYPYGFVEWINGSLNHGRKAVWVTGAADHFLYWLKESRSFGLAPLIASVLAISFSGFRSLYKATPKYGFVLGFAGLMFFGLCWYFGVRQPARWYNLQALSPLMFVAVSVWMTSRLGRCNSLKSWSSASHLLIFSALLLCSLGMLRNVVLFGFFLKYGESYKSAAGVVESYLNKADDVLEVRDTIIPLSSSPKMRGISGDPAAEYCIIAQTYSGLRQPPLVKGYTLIENRFVDYIPKVMGVFIASSPGGYNLAIYKKNSASTK